MDTHSPECATDRDGLCWAVANECAIENWIDFTQCDPYALSRFDAPLDVPPEQAAAASAYGMAMAQIDAWTGDYIDGDMTTCYANGSE